MLVAARSRSASGHTMHTSLPPSSICSGTMPAFLLMEMPVLPPAAPASMSYGKTPFVRPSDAHTLTPESCGMHCCTVQGLPCRCIAPCCAFTDRRIRWPGNFQNMAPLLIPEGSATVAPSRKRFFSRNKGRGSTCEGDAISASVHGHVVSNFAALARDTLQEAGGGSCEVECVHHVQASHGACTEPSSDTVLGCVFSYCQMQQTVLVGYTF